MSDTKWERIAAYIETLQESDYVNSVKAYLIKSNLFIAINSQINPFLYTIFTVIGRTKKRDHQV
jgi:hypothetical protein